MVIVNEIQTSRGYTQELSLVDLSTLVTLGALVHVQTTVTDYGIHRYFAVPSEAHDYVVNDMRVNHADTITSGVLTQVI